MEDVDTFISNSQSSNTSHSIILAISDCDSTDNEINDGSNVLNESLPKISNVSETMHSSSSG